MTAKVSSIHVNGWFGSYDKLTMTRRLLKEVSKSTSRRSASISSSPATRRTTRRCSHSFRTPSASPTCASSPTASRRCRVRHARPTRAQDLRSSRISFWQRRRQGAPSRRGSERRVQLAARSSSARTRQRRASREARRAPSASSMRSTSFHFAMRSPRANEPTLSWPAFQPTARCAIETSSVSPERADTIVRESGALAGVERGARLGQRAGLVRLHRAPRCTRSSRAAASTRAALVVR